MRVTEKAAQPKSTNPPQLVNEKLYQESFAPVSERNNRFLFSVATVTF